MRGREYLTDPEYAPHTPIALFDEHGKLQGWSPTFADDCAQPAAEFRLNRISDFWPEFDALRWAEIWRKSQVDGSATIVQVLARNKQCEHSELIELEIGRFLARDTPLAKVEIRRAAVRRLRLAAAGYARGHGERRAAQRHHGNALPARRGDGAVGCLLGAVRRP